MPPENKEFSLEDISSVFRTEKPATEGAEVKPEASGEDLGAISLVFTTAENQPPKQLPFADLYNPWEVGAVTGPAGFVAGKTLNRLENVLANRNRLPDVMPQGGGATSAGNLSSGEKWAQKTGYGTGEGTVREVSERYKKQFRDIGKGDRSIKGGRLWNVDQALEEIARKEALLAEEAKRVANGRTIAGKTLNAMENVGEKVGAVTRAFPRTMTGLSALGVGAEGAEAYNRYLRGDYPGMAIAGLGAIGSAASMLPPTSPWTAVAKGIGTGVGALSPFALQGYDYLREKFD